MPISWPYAFDALTNPTAADKTNSTSVPHADQHANLNDIAEALQRKVGLSDSSVVGSSAASTSVSDVLYVRDSSGRTQWGPRAMTRIAAWDSTSTGVSAVTLSGLRQDFQGLHVSVSGRSTSTGTFIGGVVQFNGDTAANYRNQSFQGGPTTSLSGSESLASTGINGPFLPTSTVTPTAQGAFEMDVDNYTSTRYEKVGMANRGVFYSTATGAARVGFNFGVWQSSAAITSIRVQLPSGGFALGSKIRVYGRPD